MSNIKHLQVFKVGHRISWPRLKTAVNDHPPHPGVLLLGPEVLGSLLLVLVRLSAPACTGREQNIKFGKFTKTNGSLSPPLLLGSCLKLSEPQDELPKAGLEQSVHVESRVLLRLHVLLPLPVVVLAVAAPHQPKCANVTVSPKNPFSILGRGVGRGPLGTFPKIHPFR